MLIQPESPPLRRRDPLRLAELQVYNECMQSDRAGRVLYEVKTSLNTPELDFAVWLEDVAIFGIQVNGPPTPSTAANGSASPTTGWWTSHAR